MSEKPNPLVTPILLNTPEAEWPDDEPMFYILASNGLYRCRNTNLFTSCVKTDGFPSELLEQKESLVINYPKLPKEILEITVAFFDKIYDKHSSEAVVVLYLHRQTGQYVVKAPRQWITVYKSYFKSNSVSMEVKYEMPTPDSMLIPVGTIHSHCDMSAFHSGTDIHDEEYFTGFHITIGKILSEPPDMSMEAVVDKRRFKLNAEDILEGYDQRRMDEVSEEWMNKMEVHEEEGWMSKWSSKKKKGKKNSKDDDDYWKHDNDSEYSGGYHSGGYGGGGYGGWENGEFRYGGGYFKDGKYIKTYEDNDPVAHREDSPDDVAKAEDDGMTIEPLNQQEIIELEKDADHKAAAESSKDIPDFPNDDKNLELD